MKTILITRFLGGQNKIGLRFEVELCIRRNGEEIRNLLHRIERTKDNYWPDDMNGMPNAQHNAE